MTQIFSKSKIVKNGIVLTHYCLLGAMLASCSGIATYTVRSNSDGQTVSAVQQKTHASVKKEVQANDSEFKLVTEAAFRQHSTMIFKHYGVNPTIDTKEENISTFSVDVDTASYRIVKAFLDRGVLPVEAAIRVEEFVNYFNYQYKQPSSKKEGENKFSFFAEAFPSPNRKGYHLLHLGLQTKKISNSDRRPLNLVFVVDVSGSMQGENRLGLLKRSLSHLTKRLRAEDSVSIVAFNGNASVILEPTSGRFKSKINASLSLLQADGSTNAEAGIKLGYQLARKSFSAHKANRVILVSDGVANTGLVSAKAIFRSIEKEASKGISMMTVGIGMGNYNDTLLEKLAQHGSGHYSYINSIQDAQELFGEKLTGSLITIAKDVKLQVKFNSERVLRYRLIGYENRMLSKSDFTNDKKDAGEVGQGHSVTALYEVKFKHLASMKQNFGEISVRYKSPKSTESRQFTKKLPRSIIRNGYTKASAFSRLSYVAASFAEKLRGSYWVRNLTYQQLGLMYSQLPLHLKKQVKVNELGRLISKAAVLDLGKDKYEIDNPIASMNYDYVPKLN